MELKENKKKARKNKNLSTNTPQSCAIRIFTVALGVAGIAPKLLARCLLPNLQNILNAPTFSGQPQIDTKQTTAFIRILIALPPVKLSLPLIPSAILFIPKNWLTNHQIIFNLSTNYFSFINKKPTFDESAKEPKSSTSFPNWSTLRKTEAKPGKKQKTFLPIIFRARRENASFNFSRTDSPESSDFCF